MTNQHGVFKTARESYVFLHTVGRGMGHCGRLDHPWTCNWQRLTLKVPGV